MEETPTTFTLHIDDPHGVNVRSLFPGLLASTVVNTSYTVDSGFVAYSIGSTNYATLLQGHDFGFNQYANFDDLHGLFTGATFLRVSDVGVHTETKLAELSVTPGGKWVAAGGVPFVSAFGLSPDALVGAASRAYLLVLNAASPAGAGHLDATATSVHVRFNEVGATGPDKLWGSDYDDFLDGAGGRDKLTGNGGNDTFYFDGEANKGNLDHVTDFSHGHDRLRFDPDSYAALKGVDLHKAFHDITKGGLSHEDKGDRLLYNHNNGKLFYDPDGDKPGKHDHHPVHIVTLDDSPHLGWHDLLVE